jgi:class 3 adenylate cyclase/tetratricopeptide (TPR) repeat protein
MSVKFMICYACGSNNLVNARLCAKCGTALIARCLACDTDVQSTARFCSACGNPLVQSITGRSSVNDPNPRLLAGERKQVTILFADFSGFTAFSARLDPEDLRDNMNTIWANLDAIIIAHGGTPEKHSGDAIMAVFGGHRSREEDPAESVRAALAMQTWLKGRKPNNGQSALQMRIGIHTGLVVVGPVEHTGEFLATGDSVNLASRLEGSAPVGGVLISRETYRLVFGFFDVQTMPSLTVKGKSEPVESYLILRAKARGLALQVRGNQKVETEMIGRRQELERLQDEFKLVMHSCRPQMVTVVGEAGIGKSRLFFEFHKRTELFPQYFRLLLGRATNETAGLPFALIRGLFSARFEIQESDPAVLARDKFEHGLTGLLERGAETPVVTREELLQDIHFIGQLLGLDFSASPSIRDILDDAEQIRQRGFHGFSRLLNAISQCPATEQEPKCSGILLILEDLHWCDDGSLELIQHLIRNCPGVPLMMLCSARPVFFERHPGWCEGLPNAVRLNLDSLSISESNALMESILCKTLEIPPALREMVTEGAEGNPFYIEELIKMLMDQKVILPQADQWQIELGQLANTRIPSTLTGVLQARLDGLSPVERWVLQRASVAGRVFWDSAVEQMGSVDNQKPVAGSSFETAIGQNEILNALKDLCRKELVFRRESSAFAGSTEYTFKHELLRNVAYESLLKKSRRQYHARFAKWLQDHSGDRILEFAPMLATHFEQAALLAESAEWHGRAGQQARLGYAPANAIVHFKKALELLPKNGTPERALLKQQLEWQEGLVESLGAQARHAEALDACNVVRNMAQQLSDPVAEACAWNGMAYLHERRGDNRASVECAEQAESHALKDPASGQAERIRALLIKGWAFYRLGDVSAVLDLGGKVLELCTQQGDRRSSATSLKLLGVAHLQLGHYLKADRFFEQGLALFGELGDQRNIAAMWSNRGETARASGDYESAVGLYEKALTIARQIGHRDSEFIYLTNLSGARLGIQQFEQAEIDLRQVISQTTAPNSSVLPEACTYLSEACLGQGRLSEAIKMAQKAINLAQESESPLYLGEAWRAMGRIGAAVSKHRYQTTCAGVVTDLTTTDPVHCFAESLRVFHRVKAAGEKARTLRAWAEYELQQGDREPARKKLLEARNTFQHLGAVHEVTITDVLLRVHGAKDKTPVAS